MLNKKGLVLFLVLSLVIAVTGVFAQDVELPDVTPLEYADSDIIMAGSSTVFPLAEKMAESMAPLAILGGKSVADVLGQLLRGTQLENVLAQRFMEE